MDVLALPLPGNGKIGKRNRCSSVARNDALSASVARESAQKPILDADPIGISARGGRREVEIFQNRGQFPRIRCVYINIRGEMETNYYGR